MKIISLNLILLLFSQHARAEAPQTEVTDLKKLGITYTLKKSTDPIPNKIHVLRIDLGLNKVQPKVALGPDPDGDGPAEVALTDPRKLASSPSVLAFVNTNPWDSFPNAQGRKNRSWYAGQPVDIHGLAGTQGKMRRAMAPGNASGVNDGAAALIVGSRAAGEAAGIAPRARILAGAVAGVAPRVMGLGPVEACNKALARAGLTLEQMDVIEINEAFAAQVLGCCKQLGLAGDDERLNPNGGAIAVGHPLGASGARLALTATRQLEATGGRYALVSLCIGVGQGVAMVIERQ